MLLMRQSYRIIPIYTADVSGVCSALYELGGMTVMHDPSGCNSTYNTHDEIRWYDQESLIFISGLTEIDAITGNDRKFIEDIVYAANEFHPGFIALAGSPIPYMTGTDFPAIARIIEKKTGIPTFSVPTNGMHDYVYGAGIALEEIAKRFTDKAKNLNLQEKESRTGNRINLLGVTPLDFGSQKNVDIMIQNLHRYGWNVLSTWAMGDTLENLQKAGSADVNLVVSAVGLRAANVLWENFGTPYVIGTPNEWLAADVSKALEKAVHERKQASSNTLEKAISEEKHDLTSQMQISQKCGGTKGKKQNPEKSASEIVYLQNRIQKEAEITLIGEAVTMGSLAAGIEKIYGRSVRVFCPLKDCEGLIGEKDGIVLGEEAMEEVLKDAQIVVADPLYQPICPKGCDFYGLPHVAFSGRIYQKKYQK